MSTYTRINVPSLPPQAVGQSMDSPQVSNHGNGNQCPDGLAREESNHQDAVPHSPVANGSRGALSFRFGLGPHVGRQHRP